MEGLGAYFGEQPEEKKVSEREYDMIAFYMGGQEDDNIRTMEMIQKEMPRCFDIKENPLLYPELYNYVVDEQTEEQKMNGDKKERREQQKKVIKLQKKTEKKLKPYMEQNKSIDT